MKQAADNRTLEIEGLPKRRGRPPTGTAMTAAQRQAKAKKKKLEAGKAELKVSISAEVRDAINKYVEFKDLTLGDAVDRILRDRLLRKR
jgi:hypothetical protein